MGWRFDGVGEAVTHFRRWGAIWILALLFAGSWAGQLVTMQPVIEQQGYAEFWAATFENWQSEMAQLALQAILIGAFSNALFRAGQTDLNRIESKIDELLKDQ